MTSWQWENKWQPVIKYLLKCAGRHILMLEIYRRRRKPWVDWFFFLFPTSNLAVVVSFHIQSIKSSEPKHQMSKYLWILLYWLCVGGWVIAADLNGCLCSNVAARRGDKNPRDEVDGNAWEVEQKFVDLSPRSINGNASARAVGKIKQLSLK